MYTNTYSLFPRALSLSLSLSKRASKNADEKWVQFHVADKIWYEAVPRHPTQEQLSRDDESTNFPPAPFAQDLWSDAK